MCASAMDTYLKKIELHGFKSFPEKTTIQFHKGITAIIGPNGCGKSNLVDAILWVLGEQRIKNLRGEDNQDLIFNGSASKKALGMTEVGLFIGYKEEETFIARRFFRSGEGKYILNEKFCRGRDVQDTLFNMGIGEKTYFIFEQGAVEKMVSLKPSERRILIEEAAGIAQYLERKKETAQKLIIAQQNLDNLEMILVEKEKRLKELKNQAQYVSRYRSVKTLRNDWLKALLRKKYNTCQGEFDTVRQSMEAEINQESFLAKEIADSEETVLKREQMRWEFERVLKQDQQTLFQANNSLFSVQKETEKTQQRIEFLKQRIEELAKAAKAASVERESLAAKDETAVAEVTDLATAREEREAKRNDVVLRLDEVKKKINHLTPRDQELKKELFVVENELAKSNNEILQLEKSLVRIENEKTNKQNLIQELEKQTGNAEIQGLEAEIEMGERDAATADKALMESESAYQACVAEIRREEESFRSQKIESEQLQNQRKKYERMKEKIQASSPVQSPVQTRGFLQDLIEAAKPHHRILENLYFEEMDAPILTDPQDALKSNQAKLLIPREQEEKIPDAVRNERGFRGMARELYQMKIPGLENLFKDAVIAATLADAIAIFLKYGVPVVTEDAELITAEGILIRHREKGILDVIEEIRTIDLRIRQLAEAIATAEPRLRECREQEKSSLEESKKKKTSASALKEKIIALKSRLDVHRRNRQLNLNRLQITRDEFDRLVTENQRFIEDLGNNRKIREEVEKRKRELIARKEQFAEEYAALQEEAATIEREATAHRHELSLIDEKHRSLAAQSKDLQQRRQRILDQITHGESETTALQNEITGLLKRIQELQQEAKELELKKSEVTGVIREMELKLNALTQEVKEITTQLQSKRTIRDEVRERKKEAEITIASLKKDLFQLEETSAQEINLELKDIEADPEKIAETLAVIEEQYEQNLQKLNRMRESDRLNFSAEAEVQIVEKDHDFMVSQKEDILKSIQDMHSAIHKIDLESRAKFQDAFGVIRENFITNFKILFEGGEADLTLTDQENLLESGLEIQAQPPGKRLQSIRLLSGGEKTLTSLAFLFAMFQYKPSPFCVFDEVDASLDEANIQRFLRFLFQLKEKTQFVIITHNFKTMEHADFIYGISMDEPGISKIYSMKMN